MHKLITELIAIFFPGNPGVQTLAWLVDMKIYLVAAAITHVSIPVVVSQLNG